MKRFRKVLLALVALLGVVVAGSIWLVNSALNVASDAVDSTLDGVQKVQAVAQKEIVGVTRSVQNGERPTRSGGEPSPIAQDKPAPELATNTPPVLTAKKASDRPANQETGTTPEQSAKTKAKDEGDDLAELGGLLRLFLSDGEDSSDPTALLTASDKEETGNEAKGDRADAKNADDTLTDMISGASSPTVKAWMEGKYKGKESQALDDAIEDPKIWRLFFFLGGM